MDCFTSLLKKFLEWIATLIDDLIERGRLCSAMALSAFKAQFHLR